MSIVILGIFVADTVYRAERMPKMGETLMGQGFFLGPGGKGSNQSVAAAMAGGQVAFLTRLGQDAFAGIARDIWAKAGVVPVVREDPDSYTGAAFIFLQEGTGANAIIVSPGAAGRISVADIEAEAARIAAARVFVTQMEQPLPPAARALQIARAGGALTVLNPAPAADLPADVIALCDLLTPNETEAEALSGIPVSDPASATAAAAALLARGAGAVVVTLGAQGALYHDAQRTLHVPPMSAGPVLDTTGAGDAFNGGLAVALAEGQPLERALRFATATAALSVTRMGTAAAMPSRAEIDALLIKG
ncbi:ribokinase [Gemmobacter nectariphilus]|uniref:ribokinase n=1 Tax=Gemmobacter nectariphilus TaxID=220343 RepID=UPI0004000098|nr:ribokinase [Gemmobacter nectariphilus]